MIISYSQGASKTTLMSFSGSGSSTWKATMDRVAASDFSKSKILILKDSPKLKILTDPSKLKILTLKDIFKENAEKNKLIKIKPSLLILKLKITDPENKYLGMGQGESKIVKGIIQNYGKNFQEVKLSATQYLMNDIKISFTSGSTKMVAGIPSSFGVNVETTCNTEPGRYLITISGSPPNSFYQVQDASIQKIVQNYLH